MIESLNDYMDLMIKLDHDLKKYSENETIFNLMDCILTLNAIPEWINNDPSVNPDLRKIAEEKEYIMKGAKNTFEFEETLIDTNIDHMLRLIRLVANHSKHRKNSSLLPNIIMSPPTFPMTFPIKFCARVGIGEMNFDAEHLLNTVAEFWKNVIKQYQ